MNYGIVSLRFESMTDAFREGREIGFDGLEIPFNQIEYENELIWSDEGIQTLNHLREQHGMAIPSCMGGRYNLRNFVDDDPEVREEAERLMLRLIDQCAMAGIPRILVAFFGDGAIEGEEGIRRAIHGVSRCAPRAESQGITLALETTMDVDTHLRLVDGIGSDAVAVYYDVGNACRFGWDAPSEMRVLAEHDLLEQIHIKDMTLDHKNMPLGEGDVDWDAVFGTIREIGYDDWLVLETPGSDNPRDDYAAWLEFTREGVGD